ncbi:MAG: transglycosylase SLT domain-containing protein [Pseudobdellovibrionaceae bacterium]|nr:transglycosylase SLT domain-containing protein [Pseudobdellovibrionaceae bacterium]
MSNAELASLIDLVASCFAIDERIFTSLIRKESTFNMGAKSPTGAAGLTQMTGTGIDEVNDQLGKRGTSYALSSATQYFNNTLSECVSGYVGAPWVQLWDRGTTLGAQKTEISSDAVTALVYGAILLKTNLSVERTDNPNASMEQLYRNALRRYNGDPSEKENYQQNIMTSAGTDF